MINRKIPGRVRDLMGELKEHMARMYSQNLKGVYLYGSYARGKEEVGLDVDVLVVLGRIESYSAEIDRTGEIASDLSLKYDLSISRVFVDRENWQEGDTPFLRRVRQEAIKI
ncbi:MAG: nucleotidyltransferase domain-containing protein [Anaerolineales bacterium]